MNVGDKVMLVQWVGMSRQDLNIRVDKIKAVHKNGHIVLEKSAQKYRPDGKPTGQSSGWYDNRPDLKPWDDVLWQKFQKQQIEKAAANQLFALAEHLQKLVRQDREAAAEVWENLPYQVRALIKQEPAP